MIKSLKLKNFRSHSDSELKFTEGVNIICGDNDIGKSSILRALNWIAFNKPLGDSIIKHGRKTCQVEIEFDNFSIVRRKKKSGDNSYTIYKNGKEYNRLSAIGKSVPEEVSEILRINEVNIQNQHDSAFLLSENSGYISRYLNNLIGLDTIDISLKNASSDIRNLNNKIKECESRLNRLEEDKKQYENLEKQEKLYHLLSKNIAKYEEICHNEESISLLISDIEDLENEKGRFKNLASYIEACTKLDEYISEINEVVEEEKYLSLLIEEIGNLQNCKYYDFSTIKKKFNIVKNISNNYLSIDKTLIALGDVIDYCEKLDTVLLNLKRDIDTNKKLFKKKFPRECPLCGKTIKGKP